MLIAIRTVAEVIYASYTAPCKDHAHCCGDDTVLARCNKRYKKDPRCLSAKLTALPMCRCCLAAVWDCQKALAALPMTICRSVVSDPTLQVRQVKRQERYLVLSDSLISAAVKLLRISLPGSNLLHTHLALAGTHFEFTITGEEGDGETDRGARFDRGGQRGLRASACSNSALWITCHVLCKGFSTFIPNAVGIQHQGFQAVIVHDGLYEARHPHWANAVLAEVCCKAPASG